MPKKGENAKKKKTLDDISVADTLELDSIYDDDGNVHKIFNTIQLKPSENIFIYNFDIYIYIYIYMNFFFCLFYNIYDKHINSFQ